MNAANYVTDVKAGANVPVSSRANGPGAAPRPRFAQLAQIAVGHGPIGDVGVAPGGGTLLVTSPCDDTVAVMDSDDFAAKTVVVGGEPVAVAVADGRAYVATTSARYDAISVIDTDRAAVVATYPLDLSVTAVCADASRIVAARAGRGRTDVAIVDTTIGATSTIDLATAPGAVVDAVRVSSDGSRLYVGVSDPSGGELRMISGGRVAAKVRLGSPIRDVALSGDGKVAYVLVCGAGGGSVQIIDARGPRVVGSIETGGWPTQMTLGSDDARAYVVDGDDVLVICTLSHRIIDTLRFDAQLSGVAACPGRLYVADYAGSVTAVAAEPAAALRELRPAV